MHIFTPSKLTKGYTEVFEQLGFQLSNQPKEIFLPFGKQSVHEFESYLNYPEVKYFLQIPDIHLFSKKTQLWMNMVNYFGLDKSLKILPQTYILNTKKDRTKLEELSQRSDLSFIAKGNQQRRQSIKLINASEIPELYNDSKYKLIQEIIDSRNILSERAFNIRMFMIMNFSKGEFKSYISTNGKLVHSDNDINYISDTDHYEDELPLLLIDVFSDKYALNRNKILSQLKKICAAVSEVYIDKVDWTKFVQEKNFCQLFGIIF